MHGKDVWVGCWTEEMQEKTCGDERFLFKRQKVKAGLLLQTSLNSSQQVVQRNSLSLGSAGDPSSGEDGAKKLVGTISHRTPGFLLSFGSLLTDAAGAPF